MSESEGEATFASADEGDGIDKGDASANKEVKSSRAEKQKEKKVAGTAGDEAAKKVKKEGIDSKKETQKGQRKQQQPAGKGKGTTAAAQKEVSTNVSPPTGNAAKTPPATKTPKAVMKPQEESKSEGKEEKTQEDSKLSAVKKPLTSSEETVRGEKAVQPVGKTTEPAKSALKDGQAEILAVKQQAHLPGPQSLGGSVASVGGQQGSGVEAGAIAGGQKGDSGQAGDVRRIVQAEDSSPAVQDIPRGQQDHTPEQEEVLKKLGESVEKGSGPGWGWSTWGSSLLSAASNSVQTFTHQVGDGFTTILETVESSLGVPDPGDIVKAQSATEPTEDHSAVVSQPEDGQQEEKVQKAERSNQTSPKTDAGEEEEGHSDEKLEEKSEQPKKEGGDGWFSSWNMSDFAKKVQHTGKSLASKGHTLMAEGFDAVENLAAGGIDVLETIGKKTYSTLSEHDPAFRKTREFLSPKGNKPNLSSILREAKEKAEFEAEQEKQNEEARKAHFGTLFDDYQGIAHLEALEMLSNQSEKKVHSLLNALSSVDLTEIKPTLISIKEAFEINEEDSEAATEQDFSSLVSQCVSELQLGTAPDKLNKVHEMVKQWIVDCDSHETHETDSIKEVHQKSIQALAELTAKGVEQFHKAGELVLLERDKDKDCTERAHSLARLTGVLCHEISNVASKFVEILNKVAGQSERTDEVTPLVTNVYLEATNSSTYIQDAFQLLLPVLQQAALEHFILLRQS